MACAATRSFIYNNPDMIFIKIDKGNVIVAMDKRTYLTKMEKLLKECIQTLTRDPVPRDLVQRLTADLYRLLKGWLTRDYISNRRSLF